jgi:hypothetical protein
MRHPILENYQYDSNTIRRRNNDLTDSFPPSLDLKQVFSNPSDRFISIATPPAESSIQRVVKACEEMASEINTQSLTAIEKDPKGSAKTSLHLKGYI